MSLKTSVTKLRSFYGHKLRSLPTSKFLGTYATEPKVSMSNDRGFMSFEPQTSKFMSLKTSKFLRPRFLGTYAAEKCQIERIEVWSHFRPQTSKFMSLKTSKLGLPVVSSFSSERSTVMPLCSRLFWLKTSKDIVSRCQNSKKLRSFEPGVTPFRRALLRGGATRWDTSPAVELPPGAASPWMPEIGSRMPVGGWGKVGRVPRGGQKPQGTYSRASRGMSLVAMSRYPICGASMGGATLFVPYYVHSGHFLALKWAYVPRLCPWGRVCPEGMSSGPPCPVVMSLGHFITPVWVDNTETACMTTDELCSRPQVTHMACQSWKGVHRCSQTLVPLHNAIHHLERGNKVARPKYFYEQSEWSQQCPPVNF